jgi:hypothetical protein
VLADSPSIRDRNTWGAHQHMMNGGPRSTGDGALCNQKDNYFSLSEFQV